MDSIIKLDQNPVKQAVSSLKAATQNLNSSFPEEMDGESELDLLNQLKQMNNTYAELLDSYQALLLKHIQIMENSVDTLVETDETIANQLSLLD